VRAPEAGFGLGFVMGHRVAEQLANGRLVRAREAWYPPFAGYRLYVNSPRQHLRSWWIPYASTAVGMRPGCTPVNFAAVPRYLPGEMAVVPVLTMNYAPKFQRRVELHDPTTQSPGKSG
jgi:hypothetical protein